MKTRICSLFLLIASLMLIMNSSNVLAQLPSIDPLENDRMANAQQQAQNVLLQSQVGGTPGGVAFQGSYAYVGVGPRLVIMNVSNPAQPVFVGQTDLLPSRVFDVAVAGDYAEAWMKEPPAFAPLHRSLGPAQARVEGSFIPGSDRFSPAFLDKPTGRSGEKPVDWYAYDWVRFAVHDGRVIGFRVQTADVPIE